MRPARLAIERAAQDEHAVADDMFSEIAQHRS